MVPRRYSNHDSLSLWNKWLTFNKSTLRMTTNFLYGCMRLKCTYRLLYIHKGDILYWDHSLALTCIHSRPRERLTIERIQRRSGLFWFKFYPWTDNKYGIIHHVGLIYATRLMRVVWSRIFYFGGIYMYIFMHQQMSTVSFGTVTSFALSASIC